MKLSLYWKAFGALFAVVALVLGIDALIVVLLVRWDTGAPSWTSEDIFRYEAWAVSVAILLSWVWLFFSKDTEITEEIRERMLKELIKSCEWGIRYANPVGWLYMLCIVPIWQRLQKSPTF